MALFPVFFSLTLLTSVAGSGVEEDIPHRVVEDLGRNILSGKMVSFNDPGPALGPRELFQGQWIRRGSLRATGADLRDALSLVKLRDVPTYPKAIASARRACVKIFTPRWHGAGFFVSSDGLLLTSFHVIAGAETVIILTAAGQLYTVDHVVAHSHINDLVLLKLDGGEFASLDLKPEDSVRGSDPVFVIGHPNQLSWDIAQGAVVQKGPLNGTRFIEVSSELAVGNSGGPMLDAEGRVCGVAAYSATRDNGQKSALGISSAAVSDFLRRTKHSRTSLPELANHERGLMGADILGNLCLVADEFLTEVEMAIRSRPAETLSPMASLLMPDEVSRLKRASTSLPPIAKVVLLQIFAETCLQNVAVTSDLQESLRDLRSAVRLFVSSYDAQFAGWRGRLRTADQPGPTAAELHAAASLKFQQAIGRVLAECTKSGRSLSAPILFQKLEILSDKYGQMATAAKG